MAKRRTAGFFSKTSMKKKGMFVAGVLGTLFLVNTAAQAFKPADQVRTLVNTGVRIR